MRHLYLLRGSTGAGKSTLVKKFGLEEFTLSSDNIRMNYSNTGYKINYDEEGLATVKETIGSELEGRVWETLMDMLKERMQRGQTTIIDATHSTPKLMRAYNKLVKEYRYRIFTIQLDIPLEKVIENNQNRPKYKQVPEHVVRKKHKEIEHTSKNMAKKYNLKRFDNICDAGNFILNNSTWIPKDMSDYKKVYVIGDIHSAGNVLEEFLKEHYSKDNYYVFLGDYFDRGLEPVKTANLIHALRNKPNVVLLRGNHETNYENWIKIPKNITNEKQKEKSRYYKKRMNSSIKYIKEVERKLSGEEMNDYEKKIKEILLRVQDMFMFNVSGQLYVCTHGGIISNVLDYNGTGSMINLSANDMIRGIGKYSDDIDMVYSAQMEQLPKEKRIIQVHGHRNQFKHEVFASKYSYNVEQDITNGGNLGIVEINVATGEAKDISFKNNSYRITLTSTPIEKYPVDLFFNDAAKSKYIHTKKLKTVDDVYSINFNRKAFYDKEWNNMTVHARGLFLKPSEQKVVARSYNKFFNLNERKETKLTSLENNLKFPVIVTSKMNGFLGILTVHEDEFLYLSKSTDGSEFSRMFKETFLDYVNRENINLDKVKEFIKREDVSLVFEVINQEKDPHIINYEENGVVLLDVFKNKLKEEIIDKKEIDELQEFTMPEEIIFEDWKSLHKFITTFNQNVNVRTNPVLKGLGEEIDQYNEGFVITDKNGFKLKIKGAYYSTWKSLRRVIYERYIGKRGNPRTNLEREYLEFVDEVRHKSITPNVLVERKEFLNWNNVKV